MPLDPELDADLVLLLLVAITTFPRASPGAVQRITGEEVDDDAFQRRFVDFMARIASRLRPGTREAQVVRASRTPG